MRILKALTLLTVFMLSGLIAKQEHKFSKAQAEVQHLIKNKLIQNGDLIFQTSLSSQSQAVQIVTKSKYSHCGIIFIRKGKFYVLEAIQPVKVTPLAQWIARGKHGHYVIKRLTNAKTILTPETLEKMQTIGKSFIGKNYDLTFEWSDDNMYCSELIWKIYYRATGIQIGQKQKLRDFDISHPLVKKKMQQRYGNNIPLDEVVISPAAIFNSQRLTTIRAH